MTEKQRQALRKHMDKIKSDPILLAEYRERHKKYKKNHIEKKGIENYRHEQKKYHSEYRKTEKGKEIKKSLKIRSNKLSFRFRVMTRDNFTCQYCGRNVKDDGMKIEVDHIIPRSKGGKDTFDNLVTACYECNQGKGSRLLSDHFML